MPSIQTLSANDPVSRLIERTASNKGCFPVPLIATSYDVEISGGLAKVVAKRTFRNQEAGTIEATLSFPIPVHAVLYSLEARIGGRTLKGIAKSKAAAREKYEDAIDRGKTAVLHEELLRGIHMISVAHLAPGTEIEVIAKFALPLTYTDGRIFLRIPTTVGDVYGTPSLPDSDTLEHGGPVSAASVTVKTDPGCTAVLSGSDLTGPVHVPQNRPITIEVKGWSQKPVAAVSAGGEHYRLEATPFLDSENTIDVAVLVDHSGSMGEQCGSGSRLTKHAAVLVGLNEAGHSLRTGDRINLWQFDDAAEDIGAADASRWPALLQRLSPPRGGTQIGSAIQKLLAHRTAANVILVTDGKSYALDVQTFANTGTRFSVVLIGDDSLESRVGHLAALTGGQLLAVDGVNIAAALRSVFASLRAPNVSTSADGTVQAAIGGLVISAIKSTSEAAVADPEFERAAGAYVASLRMARLSAADAAALAEKEGLVTHLTSLVLVDEESQAQAGLPATRKVLLATPETAARSAQAAPAGVNYYAMEEARMRAAQAVDDMPSRSFSSAPMAAPPRAPATPGSRPSVGAGVSRAAASAIKNIGGSLRKLYDATTDDKVPDDADDLRTFGQEPDEPSQVPLLTSLPGSIDWRNEGERLSQGNVIGLSNSIADAIDAAALVGVVRRVAKRLGLPARLLVIGLLARSAAKHDRHADRVYRAILMKAKTKEIAHVAEKLGLAA